MKRIMAAVLAFLILLSVLTVTVFAYNPSGSISYKVCLKDKGWQREVTSSAANVKTAGKTEDGEDIRAICINSEDKDGNSMIRYRVFVKNYGWQSWMLSGDTASSPDNVNMLEAVQIELYSPYSEKYDILYRTFLENEGWMNWTKNGKTSGSNGMGLSVRAIEIKLAEKGSADASEDGTELTKPDLSYSVKQKGKKWSEKVSEDTSCPKGKSDYLQALKIELTGTDNESIISYSSFISNKGWQKEKTSGQVSGNTKGDSFIEAVKIELSPLMQKYFDIYYSVRVPVAGWLGWAKNGAISGTSNSGAGITAIKIKLVYKGDIFNSGGSPYIDYTKYATKQYSSKVDDFIHDKKWTNGVDWGYGRYPELSSWSCIGCCAYAADFVKYVFGMNDPGAGKKFTDPKYIRSGDVLYFVSDHWVCVLCRDKNKLVTAEGNWEGKVEISSKTYSIVNDTVYRDGEPFRTFEEGYHYM